MFHSSVASILCAFLAAASGAPPFVVALDPGQWRIQPRAPTANPEQYEKHLTLEIARLVQRRLLGEPGLKIVLCRTTMCWCPSAPGPLCQPGRRALVCQHPRQRGVG